MRDAVIEPGYAVSVSSLRRRAHVSGREVRYKEVDGKEVQRQAFDMSGPGRSGP